MGKPHNTGSPHNGEASTQSPPDHHLIATQSPGNATWNAAWNASNNATVLAKAKADGYRASRLHVIKLGYRVEFTPEAGLSATEGGNAPTAPAVRRAEPLNINHVNPGSDFKTRGHLGSQLERKSETNLRLEKDDNGATVVWADKNRRAPIPKATAPRFAWDEGVGAHTTIASLRSSREEAEKQAMQIEAEAVFSIAKNTLISYGQFITFLMRKVQTSKSTAKRRFSEMLRTQIIRKELTGYYALANK